MSILDEVLAANADYAASFGVEGIAGAAAGARGFAILTCMDARLDPAKFAGLSRGRRARHPQRRRARERRRDPFARDLLQAARHRASGS